MKSLRLRKPLLGIVSILVCFGALGTVGFGGAIQRTAAGLPLHWKPTTPIPFVVNPGGVPNFVGELQRLVVLGAVNDAFRAWTEVPDAAVVFAGAGISPNTRADLDGVNLVSFQDTDFPFPPGVLATASVLSAPDITGPTIIVAPNGRQYPADFSGQILEVDIIFNPNPSNSFYSPVGANNSVDIVAVGLHEVGHLLGLEHTGVFSSIMNPFSESVAPGTTGTASRTLQTDDTITIASLYPAATFAPSRGSISGIVTNSTGGPVKSASVVAFSTTGGVPVGSQLSGADGRYSIDGLPPGGYHILVEPLDGPITLANFPGFYSDGSFSFATTFLGGPTTFITVSMAAGQTTSANVTLLDRPAGILNIETLGTATQTGGGTAFLFGASPLFLPRGKSYQIFVTGQNLTSDSNLKAFGTGLTGGPTTGGDFPQPLRQQSLTVSASAPLGPSNLHLSNSGSTSVFAGGIVTTVNPTIGLPMRDAAGFGTGISPGAMITLGGSDLAFGRAQLGGFAFEQAVAKPLPTSMGGVSLKIGDRYAPLFSVLPFQVSAVVPYEVTGSSVQMTLVTGPNASGNTVTVDLSPTSPGIFTVNFQGTGQGIVLHNPDPDPNGTIVAPVGSIPGRAGRPIRPGEFMTIYAVGLGPVTPSIPSGLAPVDTSNPLRRLVNPITVRIGGQAVPAANVPFAGLNPNFVGLYQVDVQIPSNVPTGDAVSLQLVTTEGQASNTVTIAISP